jgi:hypothetical protein
MDRQITWENLLDLAKVCNTIVVSGCQRSGTTYCAQALAQALSFTHHDEEYFGVDNFTNFLKVARADYKKVIQAPAILHKLKSVEMTALIVIMTIDESDVASSMIKHSWFKNHGKEEYSKFALGAPSSPEDIYRTKLNYSKGLKAVELDYSELRKTHGFVDNRTGWGIKQTKN